MRVRREKRKRPWWPLALAALVFAAVSTLRTGSDPELRLETDLPGIGPSTQVTGFASEPARGLAEVALELVQGETVVELTRETFTPRPAWKFWGEAADEHSVTVEVGNRLTPGLREGPATLRLSARRAGTWLRRAPLDVAEVEVPVRLTPPRLSVTSVQHYPRQGGSEAAVYVFGEGVKTHGVTVGDKFFPGFSLPGSGGAHFALFAVPFDAPADVSIRVVAEDDVGNRTEQAFVDRLLPRELRADRIAVSDGFIERVAPQIEAQTPSLSADGTLVERYLAINRELRVTNRADLAELAATSADSLLWSGPFQPLENAQVMARFGDHRTYTYNGAEVDEQDHLGYDMASVKRAEVPAANAGRVVRARFTGIYGNVVVIDHGCGLLSLYGHLSSFAVEEGQQVSKGETIGRTGTTGLAGGDHLHFGMFLHGVATDPVEWLDSDWIRNRLGTKLGSAVNLG